MDLDDNKCDTCRACLVESPSKLFSWAVPLKPAIFEDITYMECFRKCTQLEVSADDNMPQSLCFQCADRLRDAYEFISKAKQSHLALHMKYETLLPKTDEHKEVMFFEWPVIQKSDSDNENGVIDKNFKTLSTQKGVNPPEEVIINVDTCMVESYYSESDDHFENNSTSTQNEDSDISYAPEKQIKVKQKRNQASDNHAYTSPKRQCRRRAKTRKTEETAEQETENEDLQAEVNCEFCHKTLPREKIKKHIKRQHNVRVLLCHACPRTFIDVGNLAKHSVIHDENRQRKFTCEQCGKKFFTRNAILNHGKTHEANRQAKYQCEQCEKQFLHKGSLKLHMIIHTDQTLQCKICEKKYPREVDLKIHMLSHTGDKPFKCRYCENVFTRVSQRNNHERTHEGFRYKCDICEKEYVNNASLTKHKKEHTGLPLKCLICGKGFVTKCNMKRHIEKVHKIKDALEIEGFILKVKTTS